MRAAIGGRACSYPAKEGVTVVVRAESAARKRSRPSSGQDTRLPAERRGSGSANGHGREAGDGPSAPGTDLPGEVAVVDLDDADGLDEAVDLESFDDLAVPDDVETLAVVEIDETEGADGPDAPDAPDVPDGASPADEAPDDGPDVVVEVAAVAVTVTVKPATEGGEGDDETFV